MGIEFELISIDFKDSVMSDPSKLDDNELPFDQEEYVENP